MSAYHQPIMVQTCLDMLQLKAGGIYVDATLGGGGHALAMYQTEPKIRLYAFDQDADAIAEAGQRLKDYNPVLIQANFRDLRTSLAYNKVKGIDGILFDLGVSSHQIDETERGFSFDRDAALDMRMDRGQELNAAQVVNESSTAELRRIFREYGEENAAGRIARAIETARADKAIATTKDLASIIESVVGVGSKESLMTKVRIFQALRIFVNDELGALPIALTDAINLLNPGGRIVVMSYHSLEDRIVKNTFKLEATDCICPPAIINCICEHSSKLKIITRRPLMADSEEISDNVRSRSAKLRVAEKKKGEQC
ncbi:MAG: 16S rRNA (cytosine(1402)-N(4))-methyltransferase RsmH [Candidatus Cloacimonetes bacterium]|nr:16S rRNA (cytosine(1402)-N(4))-methyltransferase RsmH [Candidatus Cloacimonadota bacterium]MDD2423529.1 16S rRNA (cytosine(1402)-N(4))-methyltransferase RsmH [Candidatus Cloacimonadota bacterium]MDD3562832.1 16S rRNA (cytosine(1402)-N(4))-methyltransferase RsmH [Candidatus Cloacimonadota bacterium]MDD4277550.1 16S rRNA (cytosine(1402)-N(4))-methyltransferase RsmH [Candidatus Cloacimonadota bacterium]MDY0325807.1 16S rRNA (cytosine(1402)-N(4))-methyltransferase RsmH [Candidatus Cloacimonadace